MADKVEKLDTALIRELANILTEGKLGEIEVEHGDLRIRVSMPEPVATTIAAPVAHAMAPAPMAPIAASAAPVTEASSPAAPPAKNTVTAPMVGTAYLAAEPGAAPFITVGDKVKEGQTILLVEAMKTFNPVQAHMSGTVQDILVTDGQPVEYGEALVVIA